jgi:site-specific recombinase XerD
VVVGSNPTTPTIGLASNSRQKHNFLPLPADFVNKRLSKSVNNNEFITSFLNELCIKQTQLGLSDRALAKKLGISNAYLSYIKRGQREITPAFIERVSNTLPDFESFALGKSNILYSSCTYIEGMRIIVKSNIRHFVEDFLIAKQVEGKSTATLAFYRQNLERFLWWSQQNGGSQDIHRIEAQQLRYFLAYVQTTPKRWRIGSTSSQHLPSMATVDAYWRSLQAFFSWLVKEGVIRAEANPMRKLLRPKVPRKIVQDIPLDLIRQALDEWNADTLVGARNRAIILMLLDTGMRLAECASLTLPNLNLENGVIKVWGKGQKQRLVRLGETAREAVKHYLTLRGSNTTEKLWLNEAGEPISKIGIQTMIRRLKRLGGNVRWSPHTFRNTFAINYLRGGGDPFTLQILGGWEDLEMPRHYCAALKAEDAFEVHRRASPADSIELKADGHKPELDCFNDLRRLE